MGVGAGAACGLCGALVVTDPVLVPDVPLPLVVAPPLLVPVDDPVVVVGAAGVGAGGGGGGAGRSVIVIKGDIAVLLLVFSSTGLVIITRTATLYVPSVGVQSTQNSSVAPNFLIEKGCGSLIIVVP